MLSESAALDAIARSESSLRVAEQQESLPVARGDAAASITGRCYSPSCVTPGFGTLQMV